VVAPLRPLAEQSQLLATTGFIPLHQHKTLLSPQDPARLNTLLPEVVEEPEATPNTRAVAEAEVPVPAQWKCHRVLMWFRLEHRLDQTPTATHPHSTESPHLEEDEDPGPADQREVPEPEAEAQTGTRAEDPVAQAAMVATLTAVVAVEVVVAVPAPAERTVGRDSCQISLALTPITAEVAEERVVATANASAVEQPEEQEEPEVVEPDISTVAPPAEQMASGEAEAQAAVTVVLVL
jgi:hypothetical protein